MSYCIFSSYSIITYMLLPNYIYIVSSYVSVNKLLSRIFLSQLRLRHAEYTLNHVSSPFDVSIYLNCTMHVVLTTPHFQIVLIVIISYSFAPFTQILKVIGVPVSLQILPTYKGKVSYKVLKNCYFKSFKLFHFYLFTLK